MAAHATAKGTPSHPKKNQTPARDLDDPSLYVNRELGLLSFQWRVLEEARDDTNPLLERIKFLSIVGSNLNEFFMVRVASLNAQLDAGIAEFGPDRMSPSAQLVAIRREVKRLMDAAHQCLEKELRPALSEEGIHIRPLPGAQLQAIGRLQALFRGDHFSGAHAAGLRPGPAVPAHLESQPQSGRSDPRCGRRRAIRARQGSRFAARAGAVDAAPQHPPTSANRARRQESYVWIEEVIAANLRRLFPGMQIVEAHPFHVTRDADIAIKELEADDLLETIEEGVRQRKFGSVVRLQVNQEMPQHILQILMTNLEVEAARSTGPRDCLA